MAVYSYYFLPANTILKILFAKPENECQYPVRNIQVNHCLLSFAMQHLKLEEKNEVIVQKIINSTKSNHTSIVNLQVKYKEQSFYEESPSRLG